MFLFTWFDDAIIECWKLIGLNGYLWQWLVIYAEGQKFFIIIIINNQK